MSGRSLAGLICILSASGLGLAAPAPNVVINEIFYEPVDKTSREEFIELYNAGDAPADLSGWIFPTGITYAFPEGVILSAGAYLVVAEDPQTFKVRFGTSVAVVGPFQGKLDNEGERVVLLDAQGTIADEVDYQMGFPWPMGAAGSGSSIELINPSLDNQLGGSWRTSGETTSGNPTRLYHVGQRATDWHYRKGTSNPPANWRAVDFVEDASWLIGQAGIGYGDGDDTTVLADMQNGYYSIYARHSFTIASADAIPRLLKFGIYVDDGAVVWINGQEVGRVHIPGTIVGDPAYNDRATSHDAAWEEFSIPDPASVLRVGKNVIACHALNTALASTDFSFDASVFIPADSEGGSGVPTPGAPNSVYADNAPPQIRQVAHAIAQPRESENNPVTAKITDPDGVASVALLYQAVAPGRYIPARFPVPLSQLFGNAELPRPENPAFEDPANWTSVPMADDGRGGDQVAGDGIWTAMIQRQPNRTLIRYRIAATDTLGASVRVPYRDDASLNFAYFVYNGVPDYVATTSILGVTTVHRASMLTTVPVYHVITRNEDWMQAVAPTAGEQVPQFNAARWAYNWEGTIVYNGVAYDHIRYRLRGANGRYQIPPDNPSTIPGKRHWRFKFNKGNRLKAIDKWGKPFPLEWSDLNTCRMFGNRLDGNWGLGDMVNDVIWNAYQVPAPAGFPMHLRVVDGQEEAPAGAQGQYLGDFWGLARVFENYDVRFLDAHKLPRGNLYKLINDITDPAEEQRYQAPDAVSDGSDFTNIENYLRPTQPDAWLNAYVDYEEWYRYHSVVQALRHYDYWPEANKNATWYFYPLYTAENNYLGRMWTLPFDADATWGPTWNEGKDRPYDAIYGGSGKPEFQKQYRNHIREVRDLLWQRDQLEPMIRQTASFMDPLEEADIDRWRNAPAEACRQYFSATNQRNLEGKIQDMLNFAFVGGSWPGGSVGAGGRAAFLDSLADTPDSGRIPDRPTVTYRGAAGYPIDDLTFESSAFADPQGAGTFKAMKWRIAEVTQIANPGSIPLSDPIWKAAPVKLELEAVWETGQISPFSPRVTIPMHVVAVGKRYRVRVRMVDATDIESHWSAPVEFVAGPPTVPIPELDGLRVSEIMYYPKDGADFEFIELVNRGNEVLDLTNVWFSDGIEFRFQGSRVTELAPGEIVLVVRNLDAFSRRYDTTGLAIAGEYLGRLEDEGERLALTYGTGMAIQDLTFDDVWYPETAGMGLSLNAVDLGAPGSAWSTAENWFPSSVVNGTPGEIDPGGAAGGFLRPGDANLDGSIDISDAVGLLRLLFSPVKPAAPCEAAGLAEPGNVALLDFNGSGGVNVADAVYLLRYLFQSGPVHARGVSCLRIVGCPNACGGP